MTIREKSVINAFINVVKAGERSYDYSITMLEDDKSFGYLTEEAKEAFYSAFNSSNDHTETEVK
jgi:hypothetical protein